MLQWTIVLDERDTLLPHQIQIIFH